MKYNRPPALGARLAAATTAALTLAAAGIALAAPASAAPATVDDATFAWSINDESGGGAFFGGCNFLVAGAAGNAGGSRLWTEADGFYATTAGDVSILKPTADGGWVEPTWSTKCQTPDGGNANTGSAVTGNIVQIAGGSGTVDIESNTAEIGWEGDFTVVFYGGMTYWTASDPHLSVAADGTVELTVTAGGYQASMEDPSIWVPIEPTEITFATLTGVDVTEHGFEHTPDYLGVEVEAPAGTSTQVRTGATWGAFPQDFVTFQGQTGQSSYWYSSGGSVDARKVANPMSVAWVLGEDGEEPTDPGEPGQGSGDIEVGVDVPEAPTEPEEPGALEWSIEGAASVNLGQAGLLDDGRFYAEGMLPTITVTDSREDAPAWELTGHATDFTSGTAGFGAEYLGWSPQVLSNPGGAYPGSSTSGTGGLATAARLAIGLVGHNAESSTITAALDLVAPADTEPGSYSSTITLTMVG
ncbi:hypothetical protein [Pseudactinotalea suaedae]|uniref:hypothetical protein n=1 Tax=Pseudactinotalea suaedae TaxID=1524924 RepID=UPI0012E11D03|nr:hypothetical protein [Pseudactinotalea suaedae]